RESQLEHRELVRVAQVDWALFALQGHEAHEALDEIIDVAERTSLQSIAIDREILAAQRLDDEVRNHTAVVDGHARAVGVEDAHEAQVHALRSNEIHCEGFGAALTFVVTRADTDRIDVTPIRLRLRMDLGIAIDFARRRLEEARAVLHG